MKMESNPDSVKAVYLEQKVPDYCGNPLIEALPPIWLAAQSIRNLTVTPKFHPKERELERIIVFIALGDCFDTFSRLIPTLI